MKHKAITRILLCATVAIAISSAACVELSRTQKMTTFSGKGKGARPIPGYEGQKIPEK